VNPGIASYERIARITMTTRTSIIVKPEVRFLPPKVAKPRVLLIPSPKLLNPLTVKEGARLFSSGCVRGLTLEL
jgi:hypothetical protein